MSSALYCETLKMLRYNLCVILKFSDIQIINVKYSLIDQGHALGIL